MSITEKIAVKIGNNAKVLLNIDENNEQIIIYGAINLFQIIFAFLWVIIAALFFGVLYEALAFTITVCILRKYSGGGHASSSTNCIIIGTTLAVLAGITVDKIFYKLNIFTVVLMSIIFMGFSLIIVIKNAPVDSIKKPITNIEMKKQFKNKSIIVVILFSIILIVLFALNKKYYELYYIKLIDSISFGVLWQTITLTKYGICLLNKVDFVLIYIKNEGGKLYEKSN